jgi:hypothetical protein
MFAIQLEFYKFVNCPHSTFDNFPNLRVLVITAATSGGKGPSAMPTNFCTHLALIWAYTKRTPVSRQNFRADASRIFVMSTISSSPLCSSPPPARTGFHTPAPS